MEFYRSLIHFNYRLHFIYYLAKDCQYIAKDLQNMIDVPRIGRALLVVNYIMLFQFYVLNCSIFICTAEFIAKSTPNEWPLHFNFAQHLTLSHSTGWVICSGTANRGCCDAVYEVTLNFFYFLSKFNVFQLGKTYFC